MVDNPVQFAVVREDPSVEREVTKRVPVDGHVFLIGSGGCTALTMRDAFPRATLTVLDPNPAQIALIQDKVRILRHADSVERKRAFGVGKEDPLSLTGSGNFESLFRSLRGFLYEFVMDREAWVRFFIQEDSNVEWKNRVFDSKYWPVAFQLFFSDPLLLAMFGPNAIQYAPRGSYPAYFQRILEAGLLRADAKSNYFLQHIFLGHYVDAPGCLPSYLTAPFVNANEFVFVQELAQNGPDYGKFDVISLSNIFDWMDKPDVVALTERLVKEMKPGAWIIFRQLNNSADVRRQLASAIRFDDELAIRLHEQDRSLFYSSIHVGKKVTEG